MKIERIKKSHKKEIVVGVVITVCLISVITLVTTRAKYKVTQNIKLVNGTVNYKVPDVRIVAVYLNDGNGDFETNNIPTNGYNLNIEKSICKVYDGTTSIEDAPKDNNISIEYKEGKINILGVSKKNTRCYLYFDKKKGSTSEDTLTKLNITNTKESPATFSGKSTTDEGIYSVSDGMYGGTSYYWRGATTTNHALFANKCWRIVRVNGDGSIRLIYNGAVSSGTCKGNGSNSESIAVSSQAYNTSYYRSEYVGWTYTVGSQRPSNNATATASNAKTQTENWFNTNIAGTDSEKVAIGKFCNDRSVGTGNWNTTENTFYYGAYSRLNTTKEPTLDCPERDVYALKVGAITADEVIYAGGWNTNNTSYYLYNGRNYWTMSPYGFEKGQYSTARMYIIWDEGELHLLDRVSDTTGIRPVINLRSDITFSSGDGTQNNPYVVE